MEMLVQNVVPTAGSNISSASQPAANAGLVAGGFGLANAGPFSAVLGNMLGQQQSDGTETDAALLFMMLGMNPAALVSLMPQLNAEQPEQAAAAFVEALRQSPAAVQAAVLANPELQKWLQQASAWLAERQGVPDSTAAFASIGTPALAGLNDDDAGSGLQNGMANLQNVIERFVAEMNRAPQNPKVQQLAQSLQAAVHPLTQWMSEVRSRPVQEAELPLTALAAADSGKAGIATAEQRLVRRLGGLPVMAQDSVVEAHSGQPALHVGQTRRSDALQSLAWLGMKAPIASNAISLLSAEQSGPAADQTQADSANMPSSAMQGLDWNRTLQSDMAPKPVPQPIAARQFAAEMGRFILKNMKITQLKGLSEAKISLVPEHLGQVDVRISIHNGQIVAQFMTETLLGKETIENQLAQLRTALQNQGLQVDRLEVSQNSISSSLFQDQRQQQSSQQFFSQPHKSKTARYDEAQDDFILELEHEGLRKPLVYGNSFDVTA